MSDTRGNDPKGPGNGPSSGSNLFLDALFWLFAGISLIVWDATTKRVLQNTYCEKDSSGRYNDINPVNLIIGVVFGVATGVGVGYHYGWDVLLPWYQYTAYGVIALFAAVFAIWPVLYSVVLRWPFKLSSHLWSRVNIDGRYSEKNDPWFTRLLSKLAWIGIVVCSAMVLYYAAVGVQTHQSFFLWAWIGGAMAIVFLLLTFIACIGGLVVVANMISGKASFVLGGIMILLGYYFWGNISAIYHGLFANLSGSDWGAWGYVPGGFVGLIAGGLTGAALAGLLNNSGMRIVAVAFGAASTYMLAGYSDALVAQIPLAAVFGPLSWVLPMSLPWLAYALELTFFIGIAFPLLHVAATEYLPRLADLFDIPEKAYAEPRGGYREFWLQVITLAAVVATVWFGPAYVTAYIGWTNPFAVYGLLAGVALVIYTIGGSILTEVTGQWPFGLAVSGYAAVEAFKYHSGHQMAFGEVGSWGSGVLALALTFLFFYPVAYFIVRALTASWLAAFLRDPLVKAHDAVCEMFGDILENIFGAARRTYNDETPYKAVFAQLMNITGTAALVYGMVHYGPIVGFQPVLVYVLAAVLGITFYSLIGATLNRVGAAPIGFLAGCLGMVVAGIFAHSAQPLDWGNYRYILSVVVGIAGGAFTYGAIFPWAYVIVRGIINVFKPEKWLRPFLVNIHEFVWKHYRSFWMNFKEKRAAFKVRFAEARKRFTDKRNEFNNRNGK